MILREYYATRQIIIMLLLAFSVGLLSPRRRLFCVCLINLYYMLLFYDFFQSSDLMFRFLSEFAGVQ